MDVKTNSNGDWRLLLSEKVVFLTGGAGWIARHIARTCYEHGARIVLADLNIDTINKVKEETFGCSTKTDDRILLVQIDVLNEETIEKAIQSILNQWKTIDILINTSAIFTLGYVENVTADQWTEILNVNVRGYALVTKHVVPVMKQQNSGSIINIASAAGVVAHSNFLPYSTSKGAIIQMTRNLALDLGSFNIRVNSISPGAIESPTIYRTAAQSGVTKEQFDEEHGGKCLKRLGQAQEIANLVVFLASNLCTFITGSNIIVDGGYTTV